MPSLTLVLVIALAMVAAQAAAAPTPETTPAASSPATPPAAALQPPQDIEFKARFDDSTQRYILRLPEGFDPGVEHDLMIALHGHGSDRHQYAQDNRGECRGARDVAASHAMIFVSPDYRAPTSWMGPAAEADMVQLIEELKARHKVRRVFLVGGSMGGTAALTFAALHPALVDGISSQNGMANLLDYDVDYAGIQEAIKASFGGRKDETPAQYKKRCPEAYTQRSAATWPERFTMPLSITVGGDDTIVPPASVLLLAQRVRERNARVLIINRPHAGHATTYEDTVASIEFVISQ